ncbi:MAG: hypothetical protein AAGI53_07635 [Planctomycetota bacterium]
MSSVPPASSRSPGAPPQADSILQSEGVVAIRQSAVRWTLNIVALIILGPLAAMLVTRLVDRHGGHDVSLLLNTSLPGGLFALTAIGAIGVVAAALGARISSAQMGRTVAGLTVAWAAFSVGDLGDALRAAGPGFPAVITLVIEAALLGVCGIAMLWATVSMDREASKDGTPISVGAFVALLTSKGAMLGIVVAAAGALVGSWLVARDDLRGQAFFAGVLGAILGAAASRITGTMLPGGDPANAHRPEIPAVGVFLAGMIAPFVLVVVPGLGGIDEAARGAQLTGPGAVSPLDWLGGALLGTTIGINWAGSLLESSGNQSDKK